tara:strand:+ start:5360 stop:5992 length:633 start_codon:yes stop_codon:yes gene_type:complete
MNSFIKYGDNLIAVSVLLIGGFYFRFIMQAFGQTWIMTKAHTATIIILPIITYVITSVISGNIALSLGMVGALSIVRFRNPVRSPLELSTYFGAITMGIAASVSIKWLLFLILSITAALIALIIVDFLFNKILNRPLFITSFSEGNTLSILTIKASNSISICEQSDMLQSKVVFKDSITYSFTSSNFSRLVEFEQNDEVQANIISSELRR